MDDAMNIVFAALRNWFRGFTEDVWRMVRGGGASGGFPVSRLVTAVVIIVVVSVALDWLTYLIRWRPHRLWLSNIRRRRRGGLISVEVAQSAAYAEDFAAVGDSAYAPERYQADVSYDDEETNQLLQDLEELEDPAIDSGEPFYLSALRNVQDNVIDAQTEPPFGSGFGSEEPEYGYPQPEPDVELVKEEPEDNEYEYEYEYAEPAPEEEESFARKLTPRFFSFLSAREKKENRKENRHEGVRTVTGKPAQRRGLFNLAGDSDEAILGLQPLSGDGFGFHDAARPRGGTEEDYAYDDNNDIKETSFDDYQYETETGANQTEDEDNLYI